MGVLRAKALPLEALTLLGFMVQLRQRLCFFLQRLARTPALLMPPACALSSSIASVRHRVFLNTLRGRFAIGLFLLLGGMVGGVVVLLVPRG